MILTSFFGRVESVPWIFKNRAWLLRTYSRVPSPWYRMFQARFVNFQCGARTFVADYFFVMRIQCFLW